MLIRGYIGEDKAFDDVMVEYADWYADCTEKDHSQLILVIEEGVMEIIRDL